MPFMLGLRFIHISFAGVFIHAFHRNMVPFIQEKRSNFYHACRVFCIEAVHRRKARPSNLSYDLTSITSNSLSSSGNVLPSIQANTVSANNLASKTCHGCGTCLLTTRLVPQSTQPSNLFASRTLSPDGNFVATKMSDRHFILSRSKSRSETIMSTTLPINRDDVVSSPFQHVTKASAPLSHSV